MLSLAAVKRRSCTSLPILLREFVFLQDLTMQLWLKLLLLIIPLALGGTVIHVLVQRIRELRSGETDDLHKY